MQLSFKQLAPCRPASIAGADIARRWFGHPQGVAFEYPV